MQVISRRYVVSFLVVFVGYAAEAQGNLDSLKAQFYIESDDSLKCLTLDRMLHAMRSTGPADSSIHYGHILKALARGGGFPYFEMRAHVAIGLAYAKLEETDSVIQNYRRAAALCRPGTDDFAKASILNSLGVTFQNIDLYDSAYSYYLQTLALLETLDKPGYVARTRNNIGNVFWLRRDYKKALGYYQAALADERHLGDSAGMPYALTNIANAYNELGNSDSALVFMNEAISIYKILGNKKGEALALADISFIHTDRKEYGKALVAARRSLALSEEIDAGQQVALSLQSIGSIYLKLKNYREAIAALQRGLEITDRLQLRYVASNIHEEFIDVYKAQGNYHDALRHAQLLKAISDSIYNEDKSKLIAEYEARYESEKKTKELAVLYKNNELQESELRGKTLQQNALIGGSVILAIGGFAFFRVYRSKQEQKRKWLDQQLEYEKKEAGRLQELDEAKSRFFANIAHELRTPLTLIQGPAEMLLEESRERGAKDNAQLILRNASRLLSLTNRLLDLTKLEAGMVKLQPVRLDFITFAKGCLYSFESLADENDIRLAFESAESSVEMDADPEKCGIILNNLVSNAIKFTPPFGLVSLKIDLVAQTSPFVRITVQDSGIGIDANSLPNIFDRFYQADDARARSVNGTGIGLSLVKELTELHEGSIEVTSSPGNGTTFTLLLPQRQANAHVTPMSTAVSGDAPAQRPPSYVSAPAVPADADVVHDHTVLVVEDNEEVRGFIVGILAQFYHILEAKNGVEGVAIATEAVPDLIISDVMMPEMDGYEYCRTIKHDGRTSHIPVVLLTAKAGIENRLEGLEFGADDFLAKPFHGKELLIRIRNLIRVREQLQLKYRESADGVVHPVIENNFITKIKEVVEEHIDQEFSVDDLAKAIGMSRTQIHRKLKALTGQSTTQFIRRYKLDKALVILQAGDLNVSEVAFRLGFNSLAYFSTSFTQHHGYAPSEASKRGAADAG